MEKQFWHVVLTGTLISLFAFMWVNMLGIIQLPWYKDLGAVAIHLIVALFGLMAALPKIER